MSIQDWAAISEIVGAIAIIVSLIYVGVQLRQNTRATRVITSQAFVQTYGGVVSHLQEPEFRDIFWRGLAGLSNLHGGELAAFGAWIGFESCNESNSPWLDGSKDSAARRNERVLSRLTGPGGSVHR